MRGDFMDEARRWEDLDKEMARRCEELRHSSCSSPSACSVGFRFRLTTLPHVDEKITQELQEYMGDQTRTLSRWVIDTREQGVRDALVQLGWTPPNRQLTRKTTP